MVRKVEIFGLTQCQYYQTLVLNLPTGCQTLSANVVHVSSAPLHTNKQTVKQTSEYNCEKVLRSVNTQTKYK